MAQLFEAGATVRLKSSGPIMTVDGYNGLTGKVVCKSFVGDKPQTGEFDERGLKPVDPDEDDGPMPMAWGYRVWKTSTK